MERMKPVDVIKESYGYEKRKRYIGLRIIMGIVLLLVFGVIYQNLSTERDMKRYPHPGELIDVGLNKLHIYSTGIGNPTIVMIPDSKAPSAYTDYSSIYPKLSELTRICLYDRPGRGWSGETSISRTTLETTREFHKLLEASEKPPYVLVANYMGSMEAIMYAQKYPDEVLGIVLIDGVNPGIYVSREKPQFLNCILNGLQNTGIIRLLGNIGVISAINERGKLIPEKYRDLDKAMIYKNLYNNNFIMEEKALWQSADSIITTGNIEEIPLMLITGGKSEKQHPGWNEWQTKLLGWSKKSKQVVVKDCGHQIHLENPEKVVSIIEEFLKKLRKEEI